MNRPIFLPLVFICFLTTPLFLKAQTIGDYRSKQSGTWDSESNWEVFVTGNIWEDAPAAPSSTNGAIEIRSGHVITISAAVTVDQVTVTGELVVDLPTSNSLTVANGSGADILVNGILTNKTTATRWSFNSGAGMTIGSAGTFIHTSGGVVAILNDTTLETGSTWVYRKDTSTPSTSESGKTYENLVFETTSTWGLNLSGASPLTVNGNFTIGSNVDLNASGITINFGGDITAIGDFTPRSISVGSGKSMTVSGTLDLQANVISGAGSFILSPGATIQTSHLNGLGSGGAIQTASTSFSSSANYEFVNPAGNSQTGIFATTPTANTVNKLRISNPNGDVSLSQNLSVANMTMNAGRLLLESSNLTISVYNSPAWGANTTTYIVPEGSGTLTMPANTSTVFPVGTANNYMPCQISGTGSYSVRIADLTPGTSNPELALIKEWVITGSGSMDIDYQWHTDAEASGFAGERSALYLYKHDGSSWSQVAGPVAASNPSANIYTVGYSNINCCSGFVVGGEALLPVELAYFRGKIMGDENRLEWATFSETNSWEFILEKSEKRDFSGIETIKRISAAGFSMERKSYAAFDFSPAENNYYRLKIVDLDGRYEYSHIVELKNGQPDGIQVYPNLITDVTTIYFKEETAEATEVVLVSMAGKVWRKWQLPPGIYEERLPMDDLPGGMYFLKIQTGNDIKVEQLVKQKAR